MKTSAPFQGSREACPVQAVACARAPEDAERKSGMPINKMRVKNAGETTGQRRI